MPVYYQKSTELESLSFSLGESILQEQSKNPLHSPHIILPNQNMKKWLSLHLAKTIGIVANVEFTYLERALEITFLNLSRDKKDTNPEPFPGQEEIQKKILTYLIDNRENPEFSDLTHFLNKPGKLFYLAHKLSLLFRDYEANRRNWLQTWWDEKYTKTKKKSTNFYERFQQKIYSDIFLPDKKSPKPLTLTQWFYTETGLLDFHSTSGNPQLPFNSKKLTEGENPSLHLFCLSQLGHGYLEILEQLAIKYHVNLFFYQFHSHSKSSHFQNWHKPQTLIESFWTQRHYTRILEPKESKISYSQGIKEMRSILSGSDDSLSLSPTNHGSNDGSVRIWNAPSIYRELESTYQDILYKLSQDPGLHLEEIAILVTDMNTYRPGIEWVFEGGCLIEKENSDGISTRLKLPYSLTDISASESSYLYRALDDIWTITSSNRINFSHLVKLLLNPVLFRFLNEEEKTSLVNDLMNLGTRYEEESDSNSGKDPYLISGGIQRARLSQIYGKSSLDSGMQLPEFVSENSVKHLTYIWDRILTIKNSLHSIIVKGKWEKENLENFSNSLEDFLDPESDSPESFLLSKWKEGLLSWEGIEVDSPKDSLELIRFITKQIFLETPFRKGDYLTSGINISLLQPMRPIPFRHIYILGLGEGKFPAKSDQSQINLRNSDKKDTDTSRREIQESLFWETLHSARESITLSYVGKDIQQDKIYEPSSTLYQFMEIMKIHNPLELPIHSYSSRYTHEEEDMKMGLISYDYSRNWNGMRKDTKLKILEKFQDVQNFQETKPIDNPRSEIHLKELLAYYKDPMDSYLKRKMKMYISTDEYDENDNNRELFYLSPLQESILIKKFLPIFLTSLSNSELDTWDATKRTEILETIIQPEFLNANFPNKSFGMVAKKKLSEKIESIVSIFEESGFQPQGMKYFKSFSMGDTGLRRNKSLNGIWNQDLTMNYKGKNLTFLGEWENVFWDSNGGLHWIFPKSLDEYPKFNTYSEYPKNFWLDHSPVFFLNLYAIATNTDLHVWNFHPTKPELLRKIPNLKLNQDQARDILKKLTESMDSQEIVFFPSNSFARYFEESKIRLDKENFWQEDEFWMDSASWQEYLLEGIDIHNSYLSPLLQIYPETQNLFSTADLEFARLFYKPLLDFADFPIPKKSNQTNAIKMKSSGKQS